MRDTLRPTGGRIGQRTHLHASTHGTNLADGTDFARRHQAAGDNAGSEIRVAYTTSGGKCSTPWDPGLNPPPSAVSPVLGMS